MSDSKKINIKISADVSKFKSSMDNATKQIKKFKTETKTAGNTKLDNVNKQIEKINNKTKQLNNTTKNTTKNFKNVNSVKLESATKQVEKINKKVAETSKKTADSTKKFTSLKDKINSIKDKALSGVSKTMSSLRDKATGANSSTGKLKDSISNLMGKFSTFKGGNFSEAFSRISSASLPIPGRVKAIIASITLLVASLKKLYDAGKQRFFEGLTNVKDTLAPVSDAIASIGSSIKTTFESITEFSLSMQGLATAGINFETQMNKVQQLSGATGNQLAELTNKAKELGSTTRFQAYQIGQGFEYMSMAGWNASEMLSGINSVVNLSILSSTGLGVAADIVTDDLTAMGLEANQASDFVDKLAATITRSNTNVELYGEAMKQCGSQAGTLGISVTDLNTAIGLMANSAKKGSSAGMSLKNLMANMSHPTDQQTAALKELGLTADKTGSYLKTTADGNVDLAATCKSLMKAMDGMNKTQKTSLITTIAGKNAAPGILALLSQGENAWNELSDSIENSTSTVQFWNENMSIMGKKGNEARKIIDNFKDVYDSVEERATDLGFSTKDLALSIQVLGADGKVTKKNMSDLLDVFESMDSATGKSAVKWRELGGAMKNTKSEIVKNVKSGYDYDSTISKIDSDTSGLTQKQKKQIESQINANMTYKEANKILKKYGLSADHVSLSSLNTSQKLEYLRETTKGLSDDQRKAALKSLGLSDSFDEVTEVCRMSDKDFKKYQKNLETIEGLSSKMAKAMDSDTKGSLLSLASAIEGKAIQVFEKLKGSIKGASNTLAEFFGAWQNQGLEKALLGGYKDSDGGIASGLVKSVQNAAKQIPQAIKDAISSVNNFISGGSLQGILDIGTSIVQNICNGIRNNREGITTAISDLISKFCGWIETNGATIREAGKVILTAIGDGIRNNREQINTACGVIYDAINDWAEINAENVGTLGGTVADKFIIGFIKGFTLDKFNWLKGFFAGLFNSDGQDAYQQWGISNGEDYTNGVNSGLEKSKTSTSKVATEMGDGISKGIMAKLETMNTSQLKELEKELKSLQTTTQNVANGIGSSFGKIRNTVRENLVGSVNIGRNQFVNLANIIRNQSQNARNSATKSFISLRKVINTQITQARTAVTSKMISIANVVRTQSQNARNNATRNFISLRKVIQTQMSQAYSSVSSYMNKIAHATNRTLNTKVNVTRSVRTVNEGGKTASALATLSTAAFSSLNAMAVGSNPGYAMATGNYGSGITGTSSAGPVKVEIPELNLRVDLDGRQVGYSTAKYVDEKLTATKRRDRRKQGGK
ncbi:Phage tail tape measure protein, TP901 family [human gut metagenome]|uniref:Phage tail tape measure protein, TP901 family n=1 Tax=human gut metagenome TaxID=408170 RepID=W1WJM2_9ZZZZ